MMRLGFYIDCNHIKIIIKLLSDRVPVITVLKTHFTCAFINKYLLKCFDVNVCSCIH